MRLPVFGQPRELLNGLTNEKNTRAGYDFNYPFSCKRTILQNQLYQYQAAPLILPGQL